MGFKLTKKEDDQRTALIEELRKLKGEVEDAVSAFNAKMLEEFESEVLSSVNAYNEAVERARGFVEDIANERRSEYDEKSEKWQESDRGNAVDEWIGEYENVTLDEIDAPTLTEVEVPEMEQDDALENLPDEVQG